MFPRVQSHVARSVGALVRYFEMLSIRKGIAIGIYVHQPDYLYSDPRFLLGLTNFGRFAAFNHSLR